MAQTTLKKPYRLSNLCNCSFGQKTEFSSRYSKTPNFGYLSLMKPTRIFNFLKPIETHGKKN